MPDEKTMADLVSPSAKLEKIASKLIFTEGPIWMPDTGRLIFSDIPADEMKRWNPKDGSLATFRKPSHNTNGNNRDRQGRLISCEHSSRRVTRTENDGTVRVLADRFEGKRFNSPNDLVTKSDHSIWFTDPPYGTPKNEKREIDKQLVFRLDPGAGKLSILVSDFDMPNGLCFSPDESRLYIADSGKPHHVRVFDVHNDKITGGDVFCVIDKGVPDGMRCDEFGNLWSSSGDGVQIFSPMGKLIGRILVPETAANLCFGGEDWKTLFITAKTSVYKIRVNVRGAVQ